jgi:hypothetical protein
LKGHGLPRPSREKKKKRRAGWDTEKEDEEAVEVKDFMSKSKVNPENEGMVVEEVKVDKLVENLEDSGEEEDTAPE